jgi:hypothetical protein
MTDFRAAVYIAGLFACAWPGLRLARWARLRRARRAVEARVNRALAVWLPAGACGEDRVRVYQFHGLGGDMR